jgi:hypothetical protein
MALHTMTFKDAVVTILFFVVMIAVIVVCVIGVGIVVSTLYNGFTSCQNIQ